MSTLFFRETGAAFDKHIGRPALLKMFCLAAFALLGACSTTSPSDTAACQAAGPDIVCTSQGAVRGVAENGTLAFKGIPYAKPPVGPLRWQPPVAPDSWPGVREA